MNLRLRIFLVSIVIVLASTISAGAQLNFAPPIHYTASPNAYSTEVADFNKDGFLDLVVGDATNAVLTVAFGNGDGTFGAPMSYPMPGGPAMVVVGDFNGDGWPDVATANYFWSTVSVLLNKGDGTFTLKATYSVGGDPRTLRVGDFNGDGVSDIIAANLSGDIKLLLGKGDGTFHAPISIPYAGPELSQIAVADLNHDGKLDLIVTHRWVTSVGIMLGHGDGTFGAATIFPIGGLGYSSWVAVGDLNGDGNPDLAINCYDPFSHTQSNIGVLFGNGQGGFSAATLIPIPAEDFGIAIGDLDGDGKLDIVTSYLATTAGDYDHKVGVIRGHGDGTFDAPVTFTTGVGPVSVTIADLNQDGLPDIITADAVDGTFSILIQGPPSPVPSINSISPAVIQAGGAAFTLTVNGADFVRSSVIQWKGMNRPTTYVSTSRLTAVIPAKDIAKAGSAALTVFSPAPGGGTSNTVTVTIVTLLNSVTLSPTSVTGGTPSTATVTLNLPAPTGGAAVALTSSSAAAGVPPSVTVPEGQTSANFTVTTVPQSANAAVTISAKLLGTTKTAKLTVKAAALSSLTLNPTKVKGGAQNSTGTVTLTGPAPAGGLVVGLSSGSPCAQVPANVTIPAGASSATFTVTTSAVSANTSVVISATLGAVPKTAKLTVTK